MIKAFLAISMFEKLLVVLFWLLTLVVLVVIFTDVGKEFAKIYRNSKKANNISSYEKNDLDL